MAFDSISRGGGGAPPVATTTTTTVVVAIDKDKNSRYAIKWALDTFSKKNAQIILLHVRTQPLTPKDGTPNGGSPLMDTETRQLFLAYRGLCARRGVQSKEVALQDNDVSKAIVDYIKSNIISTVVVGASSRNALTRAFRNIDVPTSLIETAPEFCSVYAISKVKVQTLRLASRPPTPSSAGSSKQASQTGSSPKTPVTEETSRSFSRTSWSSQSSDGITSDRGSESMQTTPRYRPPRSLIRSPQIQPSHLKLHALTKGIISHQDSTTEISDYSEPSSFQSSDISFEYLDHSYISENSRSSLSSQSVSELEAELRRVKLELKHTMDMYHSACKETVIAKQKATEIDQWKTKEAWKIEGTEQGQEVAWAMMEAEKEKSQAAIEAAKMMNRLAALESQKRENAEWKALYKAEEEKNAKAALASVGDICYRKYSIEEIKAATGNFSDSLIIGEGGYGPVYKAILDHTAVAIKVLKSDMSQGIKQFHREVEVLSCMRHPNMVVLLGTCPEYGCLVYEYMENGSLEDRIFRKNNTPPIPWRTRFRIAAEIATGLLFLHQAKPNSLVHRDLKPGNILLTRNYVSKISDVGLARLVPPSVADNITQYQMTAAVGTFCYIDPEYQRSGMLGVQSDIYSLGVILLQLVTGKPPIGLSHHVARAIERGTFSEMLDPTVTDWPQEEALSLAKLALNCCELRGKDRPDLSSVILPELDRLRKFGLGRR